MRVISLFIGNGDSSVIWTPPVRSSERQQMNKPNGNKGGMVLLNWYFLTSNLVCNSRNEGWHMVVGRSGQGPSPAPLTCHYSVPPSAYHLPSTHSGQDRQTCWSINHYSVWINRKNNTLVQPRTPMGKRLRHVSWIICQQRYDQNTVRPVQHLLPPEYQRTAKPTLNPGSPCIKYHFHFTDGKADAQTNEGASEAAQEGGAGLGTAGEHLPWGPAHLPSLRVTLLRCFCANLMLLRCKWKHNCISPHLWSLVKSW